MKEMIEEIDSLTKELDNTEDQGCCLSYQVMDSGEIHQHYGVCFSYVSRMEDKGQTKYLVFYLKKESLVGKLAFKAWVKWVMSYYGKMGNGLFACGGKHLPYVVINTNNQSNIIFAALAALRMVYEQHCQVKLWYDITRKGVDKVTAFILIHMCSPSRKDGGSHWLYIKPEHEWLWYPSGDGYNIHTPLNSGYLSRACIRDIYSLKYVTSSKFADCDGFGGVWSLYHNGGGGESISYDFMKEYAQKKAGNNPFLKNDLTIKKIEHKECVDLLVNIAPIFEEKYKP